MTYIYIKRAPALYDVLNSCRHVCCVFYREKLQVEREKLQCDADVRLRQGEVTMLQKELDAVTSTLTQLESQKKEAQKRLDELDDKVHDFFHLQSSIYMCIFVVIVGIYTDLANSAGQISF